MITIIFIFFILLVPGTFITAQHLTDIDGNQYSTVIIGYQEWMAENLRTTRFADGTPIAYPGSDQEAWIQDSTGAYAWYNNETTWSERYGALYNWHAANSEHGVCPDGWRVPDSDDRWILINYIVEHLDGIELSDAGGVLKSCRQVDSPLGGSCSTDEHPRWNAHSNYYGTDDLGFSATPGGLRDANAGFFFMGRNGYFWTSTASSSEGRAIAMSLRNSSNATATANAEQISGYSIRCMRDVEAGLPEMGDVHQARNIRATHATAGGIVTDDGGAPVIARGMVWSETPEPTLESNKGVTVDGSGAGSFTSRLLGLRPATTYHARAYATNIEGTSYSQSITFTTGSSVVTAAEAPRGSGTGQDPFLISTLSHLVWLFEHPQTWNRQFLQTADIDASATSDWPDGKGWQRIGTGTLSGFTGIYDGGGHHIDHLFIHRSESGQGLFGYLTGGALIKNLGIRHADIHGGEWYTGALAGYVEASTIKACFSTGQVNATGTNVGGLVGRLFSRDDQGSELSNTYSMCEVRGEDRVGGLAGKNGHGSVIRHSYSTGRVMGRGTYVNPLTGRDLTSRQIPVSNYWNLETSGLSHDTHASGKTTSQMQLFSSFLWWDFKGEDRNGTHEIWNIGNGRNKGLPYFSWQFPDDPGITAAFEGGSGTRDNPFRISNAHELALINFQYLSIHKPDYRHSAPSGHNANSGHNTSSGNNAITGHNADSGHNPDFNRAGNSSQNTDSETLYFKLTRDIDLHVAPFNEGQGWVPIGTSQVPHYLPLEQSKYFSGVFNGNGHAILGMFIDRPDAYQGLFGSVHNAEIKNLGVRRVNVTGGTRYIGGLAGQLSRSRVHNCFVTGKIQGAGELFFSPTASYSGGLAGNLINETSVYDSYSKAEVLGYTHTGGLVGALTASSISESFSTGSVTSLGMSGGLAGTLFDGASISNSFSHSDVIVREADAASSIGGFAGGVYQSRIVNSLSTGKIITLRGRPPANKGFSGSIDTAGDFHMSGNYWDIEHSGQEQSHSDDGAAGMSTGALTYPYSENAYSGWDFENIWTADEEYEHNEGYPFLKRTIPVSADSGSPVSEEHLANRIVLLQNYPNPFNPKTHIQFILNDFADVRLEIFTVTGRRVAVLVDDRRTAGRHQVVFDATGMASGVYIIRLQLHTDGGNSESARVYTRTMTLLK